tara:strand:- start:124 stop:291 length:168 start_codon:yes stop_codon:yes gene_type:complete
MEWNVNFKLKRKEYDDDKLISIWFDTTHIKSEIITWLEDLDYEIDDLSIEEVGKK